MKPGMEFGLLGPLAVCCGGADMPVPRGKQRTLLSVLLLNAGHVVPVSVLAEALWGPEPPPSAEASIWNYVKRLRQVLGDAGRERLCTRPPGYLIRAADDELDVFRFEALLEAARSSAREGAWQDTARQARAALALWRGEPLADAESDVLALREVPRLAELRVQAVETRLDADLHLGRHAEMIAELERLTAAHPLREHLYSLLMLALYRCGRQAEALATYRCARDILVGELGVEPGAELRELHRRVLAGDAELTVPVPDPAKAEPQRATPGELSPAVPGFTGRSAERWALTVPPPTRDADAIRLSGRYPHIAASRNYPANGQKLDKAPEHAGRPEPGIQDMPTAEARKRHGRSVIPRQLPPPVPHFAARAAELQTLDKLLADAMAARQGTVVISAIGGTAGVGKTALAVHWAHQVAHRFPDGQLYINLRGYDPSGTPLTAAEAIRRLLDALQVPLRRIPADADAQASLYRTLLAGQRMLIVLDNARDEQQVRPLLPGAAGSLVIITSRSQLVGLIIADGAQTITLDLLTVDEARELLSRRLGSERVTAEPQAGDELIESCAHLPLALAIAAGRAAGRPAFPLAALAAELRDMRDRLDVLDTRDPVTSIRTVFSWSYDNLRAPAARMFRLLGLHPGPDISAHAAASLSGISMRQAQRALGELMKSHLLNERAPGRYAFHDLLRAYAAEQADADESDAERHAALHRMLDHYLHTAHTAALLRDPVREPLTLDLPQPGTALEQMTGERQALAWFETEHPVLAAAISVAVSSGFGTHAWQLAWALGGFLDRHGYWQEYYAISATAMTAAARLHDLSGQARIHRESGFALLRLGRYQDARAHLRQALDLFAQLGDRSGQARAQLNIGATFAAEGNYGIALEHAGQALELLQGGGRRILLANVLNNIGWYHIHLGDFQQAISYCLQSLDVHRGNGNGADGEAAAWSSLGFAHYHLGRYAEAIDHYEHALRIYRDFGSRYEEADTLTRLGDAQQALGSPAAACGSWQRALTILENLHHPGAKPVRAKLCALDA